MNESAIITLITMYANILNFNPGLAVSVARTESNLNPNAIGSVGEVGLYQIRPEYTKLTKRQLKEPHTNILVGITMLKEAQDKCKHHNDLTWLVCYNSGIAGGAKIKHPHTSQYVMRVKKNMRYGRSLASVVQH